MRLSKATQRTLIAQTHLLSRIGKIGTNSHLMIGILSKSTGFIEIRFAKNPRIYVKALSKVFNTVAYLLCSILTSGASRFSDLQGEVLRFILRSILMTYHPSYLSVQIRSLSQGEGSQGHLSRTLSAQNNKLEEEGPQGSQRKQLCVMDES